MAEVQSVLSPAVRSEAVEKLGGLGYYGGKSVLASTQTGAWITSLLPWSSSQLYVEPFCGMLGVLLQRRPALIEIVNDVNCDVVNWWRAVREAPAVFGRLLDATPSSRAEFIAAAAQLAHWPRPTLDKPVDLERARLFHVLLAQGRMSGDSVGKSSWTVNYHRRPIGWSSDRVAALAARMEHVVLEQRDACDILWRVARHPHTLVYCDPPYRTANNEPYRAAEVDWAMLTDALLAQEGQCAVSGYGSEWDHLTGWHRHEFETYCAAATATGQTAPPRTEVLWTNYDPPARPLQPRLDASVWPSGQEEC